MTTELHPTAARVALLQAVADPDVEVHAWVPMGGAWSTSVTEIRRPGERPRQVTQKIRELEAAGWVKLGPLNVRYHQPRAWELTAEGRTVLANNKEKP